MGRLGSSEALRTFDDCSSRHLWIGQLLIK
ncbi:hypothetical protein ANCCAN_10567 [Ancylostoma caninum]|uniref:Uncharacterized protein n=1 Tax=Ancylostoma caninum TaxID=29170 RepID=A0A368GGD8_ANCCA|nr:hypothetical protein ANCCAN_10567 [Ancylostoma caninum]